MIKPAWLLLAIVLLAVLVILTVGPFDENPTEGQPPNALGKPE